MFLSCAGFIFSDVFSSVGSMVFSAGLCSFIVIVNIPYGECTTAVCVDSSNDFT